MAPGIILLGLAGLALFTMKKEPTTTPVHTVKGQSGKTWLTQVVGEQDGLGIVKVMAPRGSFGPHEQLDVIHFTQKGSDKSTRKLVHTFPGVPSMIVAAAVTDFI